MPVKYKSFFQNNKYLFIFLLTCIFYICLGYSLNRVYQSGLNIYFGADNGRAHRDLMLIDGVEHNRISVHPLMLILLQPVTLLVEGVINYTPAAEVVTGSLACAICVCCVYRIVSHYVKTGLTQILLTAAYGFTFSCIIFATIPETFVYSGMFLSLYWLYILEKIWNRTFLGKYDYILLFFFGITSFGITVTNYISYIIGLIGLLIIYEERNSVRLFRFIALNAGNMTLIAVLSKAQQIVWGRDKAKQLPFFWDSIFALFTNERNESEAFYMDFTISFQKVEREFKAVFVNGLFGSRIVKREGTNIWDVFFDDPDMAFVIMGGIFALAVIISVVIGMYKKQSRMETALLSLTLLFNLCLHYIYGHDEAFIYTPHYLFIAFILISIGINLCGENVWTMLALLVFGLAELFSNAFTYRHLISIVASCLGKSDSGIGAMMARTLVACLVSAVLIVIGKIKMSRIFVMKNRSRIERVCEYIYLYFVLITISCFSIIAYFRAVQ